jgi:tyrosyl-tRNA synthetase
MTKAESTGILTRGVAEIIVESELRALLSSGRVLTLKQGFDPSAPDIHLGHVVGLRKLRRFQELGHKVTLIVGDWTARIGDPSGQQVTRPMLSISQVESNARTYMEQFFKVVDRDNTELRWQSEWFSRFTLEEVIKLTGRFTVAQVLARDDFSKRYGSGNPISLAEMLYPLLQSYDSVAIRADVEFGGMDQKFNCLMGRELQQSMGQHPQQVFLVPLLIGILDYFELVTDVPEEEIAEFKQQLKTDSVNPMNLKKRLAYEIVRQFHGIRAADEAQQHFTHVFQKRDTPDEAPEYAFAASYIGNGLFQLDIAPTLVREGLVKGIGELKRLLAQDAIEVDGSKISSTTVNARQGSIIKIGKRRFVRIAIE